MAAVGLHHPALAGTLWILDQHPSLRAFDKADEKRDADKHRNETSDDQRVDRTRATAFQQAGNKPRDLRDDAGHDDQRDAVADTA